MFELTFFTPETHVRCFTAPRTVIGAGSNDLKDLPVSTTGWEPEHLIFIQDPQGIWAINQANDPFVLLDNRPFSKRRLERGASYQITLRGLSILCRTGAASPEALSVASPIQGIDEDLAQLLQEVENFPTPMQAPIQVPMQIDASKESLPKISAPLRAPKYPPLPIPSSAAPSPSNPLPSKVPHEEKPREVDHAASMAWRLVLASGVTIFLLVAAFSITVYRAFSETNTQAEFLAAQDVADVGMALIHARLHPDKQKTYNLADPEFLRAHLADLLGEEFPVSLNMTPQGHLKGSSYLLRLYTNQDISQFVIVAQPESTLWYWLIQPHTIFLDSITMQLHKTQDVRTVNRILAQSNLFQGDHLSALDPLLATSSVIPLRTLSYEINRREFAPPRELKTLRPGAENRVYNAPRYHRLSDPLFKMLAELKEATSIENAPVLEHLHAFSAFHNMVLYTIGSLHTAQKAVQALHAHFPEEPFLIGHMTLDKENHSLLASRLVDPIPETPIPDIHTPDVYNVHTLELDTNHVADTEKHPLQIKMEKLAETRKRVIEPFTQEMLSLISSHAQAPSEEFYDTMGELLQRCKKVDIPSCKELRHALAHFYLEYVIKEPHVAFTEFAAYVESAGLTAYLPTEDMRALPLQEESSGNNSGSRENSGSNGSNGSREPIDLLPWTNQIKEASSLHALDRSLLMADQWLLDQSFSNHEQPLHLMQILKQTAKLRLEQLLMDSKSAASLQERQRSILLHLLDTLLSVPPHEKEIYLKEFERHFEKEDASSLEESQMQ